MSGPMDVLKAAEGILGTLAPTVAAAIGGPFAGQAVSAIVTALGLPPGTTQDAALGAVAAANADQLIRIKQAEETFQIQMKQLEVDFEKLNLSTGAADRASARQRESSLRDWTPKILAFITTGFYIYIQYFLISHVVDASMREMVMRSLGTLDSLIGFVFGYYFGSSAGSQRKTTELAKVATNGQ